MHGRAKMPGMSKELTKARERRPTQTAGVFARLRDCVARMERESPPVFVGRREEMQSLKECVGQVGGANPKGMMRIVQGVPGTGKTSLCEEFIRRTHGSYTATGKMVMCVKMHPAALDRAPIHIVRAVHNQMVDFQAELPGLAGALGWSREHVNRVGNTLAIVFNRQTEHQAKASMLALGEHSTLDECLKAYRDDCWGDDIVVALCIDEAQNIPTERHAGINVTSLHNRDHGGRIAPLFFGLPNTLDVLAKLGVSRPNKDAILNIEGLLPARPDPEGGADLPSEARQAIEGALDYFGLIWEHEEWRAHLRQAGFDRAGWSKWRAKLTDSLERGSSDFPQHVTAGLIAACRTLLKHRGDFSPPTADAALADIEAGHRQGREAYYGFRLSGPLAKHSLSLGAICLMAKASPLGSVDAEDALSALNAGCRRAADAPSDAQAEEALDLALAKGALSRWADDPDMLRPPAIPSMATHLIERLERAEARRSPFALRLREMLHERGFEAAEEAPDRSAEDEGASP